MRMLRGCAASIVRLRYTFQIMHYSDIFYLSGLLNLWAIAEVTCGILAMSLPIVPKFFKGLQDAKLWSTLRTSLHSLTRSKDEPSNSNAASDENIAANLNSGSTSLQTCFKKYRYVTTNETELTSVSSKDGGERTGSDDDEMKTA